MKKFDTIWNALFVIYFVVAAGFYFTDDAANAIPGFWLLYRRIGFFWPEEAKTFSTLLSLALSTCIIGHVLKGAYSGWPEFKDHDGNSIRQALIRLVIYGTLVVVAVGLFGIKVPLSISKNFFEYAYVAVVALIFAGIISVLNDALGAVYSIFRRENK